MNTSSPNNRSSCKSIILMALAILLVYELASSVAEAYPASYPAYYSPMGLEEQNPNYVNLQQAIERIRQAFMQNNEIENTNTENLDRGELQNKPIELRVRRRPRINCSQFFSKGGLDFGTRQNDPGSIENCLRTIRTELHHFGK
ncbi:hypothetical protein ABEB36_005808 [Hypothenemus hampei]|uniref:Uncharacterized protein n=1 Tax=Hypothenemus hampei TaxID=57062 RepID=A0ABD1EZG7_HYPHA